MTTMCIDDLPREERDNIIQLRAQREQIAEMQSQAQLKVAINLGKHERLYEAQMRAARAIQSGVEINQAVRRAIAWANCAIDGES